MNNLVEYESDDEEFNNSDEDEDVLIHCENRTLVITTPLEELDEIRKYISNWSLHQELNHKNVAGKLDRLFTTMSRQINFFRELYLQSLRRNGQLN